MKKRIMTKAIAFAMVLTVAVAGCKKKDDVTPTPNPLTKSYTLKSKDVLGVSGTVTIAEKSSGSSESVVTVSLTGAPAGTHPAHIHMNSAIETGAVMYGLTSIEGSGSSSTTLSVSYNTLTNYDGYVNVHLDAATLGTIIAQTDIGGNEITSSSHNYVLDQDSTSGVSGIAKFEKRKNGNSLVTIDLSSGGALPAGMYPAHINLGSVTTIGVPELKKTLNAVDGATRMSMTNVRTLNDGTAITYDNWLAYDGFVTIHNATDSTDVIAKGNIGAH